MYFWGVFAIAGYILGTNDLYTTFALNQDHGGRGGDYVLWHSGLFVFDLVLVNYMSQFLMIKSINVNSRFDGNVLGVVLGLASIISLGVLLQVLNGYDLQYYDGILYSIRTAVLIIVCYQCMRHNFIWTINIATWLMIFIAIASIAYMFLMGYDGVLGGRYNLIGMGPNVSADALLLLFALNIYLYKKNLTSYGVLIILGVLCFIFIPLTGSRRALILLALVILYLNKRIFLYVILSAFIVVFIIWYFGVDFGVDIIGIQRSLDLLDQIRSGGIEDGRSEMYSTVFEVLKIHPYGVGVSNWSIQEAMARFGVGSHSHNLFLQLYLKYGFASVVFLLIYLYCLMLLIRNRLWWFAIYAAVNLNTGYGFWNDKYLLVFTITYIAIILPMSCRLFDTSNASLSTRSSSALVCT